MGALAGPCYRKHDSSCYPKNADGQCPTVLNEKTKLPAVTTPCCTLKPVRTLGICRDISAYERCTATRTTRGPLVTTPRTAATRAATTVAETPKPRTKQEKKSQSLANMAAMTKGTMALFPHLRLYGTIATLSTGISYFIPTFTFIYYVYMG